VLTIKKDAIVIDFPPQEVDEDCSLLKVYWKDFSQPPELHTALWTLKSWKLLWTSLNRGDVNLNFMCHPYFFARISVSPILFVSMWPGPGISWRDIINSSLVVNKRWIEMMMNAWMTTRHESMINYQFISCRPLEMKYSHGSFRLRTSTPQEPKSTQREHIQRHKKELKKRWNPQANFEKYISIWQLQTISKYCSARNKGLGKGNRVRD